MTIDTERGTGRRRSDPRDTAAGHVQVIDPQPPAPRSDRMSRIPGSPIQRYLARSHDRHRSVTDGTVASYIPELGHADPAWFSIAAVTLEGGVHAVGDRDVSFTIQSISKALTYALVLDDLGEPAVLARIGVEPTGEPFNSITLAPGTGLPLNPMVNAGAITAVGMIRPKPGRTAIEELLDGYARFTGHALVIDEAVRASERTTGHRNRAIAQLLRASGAITDDPDGVVETYFAQCSVAVTSVDLATIAATFANGGVNPTTGVRAVSSSAARATLAVMGSCGMYDGAGEWSFTVGLPAKSGVSGGIMVAVPGQLGFATFSPPLDPNGNSVRGVHVCRDLVRDLGLHPLEGNGSRPDPIRTSYRLGDVGSKRGRTAGQRAAITRSGDRCLVMELQGVLSFFAPDRISALVETANDGVEGGLETIIVDTRRVERIDHAALGLLTRLIAELDATGITVTISGGRRSDSPASAIEIGLADLGTGRVERYGELDEALEVAEDALLERLGLSAVDHVDPADQTLLRGLGPADFSIVAAHLVREIHPPGTAIVLEGEAAHGMFMLERGQASVSVRLPHGERRRLSTLGPGMMFGESALLDAGRRTADVHADTEVTSLRLGTDAFESLAADHPAVAAILLRNLLAAASATSGRLTREIGVLAG